MALGFLDSILSKLLFWRYDNLSTDKAAMPQQEAELVKNRKYITTLFRIVNNCPHILHAECTLYMEEEVVTLKDADGSLIGTVDMSVIKSWRRTSRQSFAWLSTDNLEFEVYLSSYQEANTLESTIVANLVSIAEEQYSHEDVDFEEFDTANETWASISNDNVLSVMVRPLDGKVFLQIKGCLYSENSLGRKCIELDKSVIFSEAVNSSTSYWIVQEAVWKFVLWSRKEDGSECRLFRFSHAEDSQELCGKLTSFIQDEANSRMGCDAVLEEPITSDEPLEEGEYEMTQGSEKITSSQVPKFFVSGKKHNLVCEGDATRPHALAEAADISTKKVGNFKNHTFNFYNTGDEFTKLGSSKLGDLIRDPRDVKFMEDESKLFIVDGVDKNKTHLYDIEAEKVVRTWDTDAGFRSTCMDAASPSVGTSHTESSLFKFDTREESLVKNELKYKTYQGLGEIATDSQNRIAAATTTGHIKLYDGQLNPAGKLKIAKTRLFGLGDPVINVILSADGSWVLGTCSSYLFICKTTTADGVSGLTSSIGKRQPTPTKLTITPEDRSRLGLGSFALTAGKFRRNNEGVESHIVSSISNYVVVWNFNAAKINKPEYNIFQMKGLVQECNVLNNNKVILEYNDSLELVS